MVFKMRECTFSSSAVWRRNSADHQPGRDEPGAVAAMLQNTADAMPCPDARSHGELRGSPALDGGAPQVCTGGAGYNSFNGRGQINALTAVS